MGSVKIFCDSECSLRQRIERMCRPCTRALTLHTTPVPLVIIFAGCLIGNRIALYSSTNTPLTAIILTALIEEIFLR